MSITGLLCCVGTAVTVEIIRIVTNKAPIINAPFFIGNNPKNIMKSRLFKYFLGKDYIKLK
jgi:RNA recognition motif-containing protein